MPVLLQDVILSSFQYFATRYDGDFVDRLNYFLTPNILLSLAILVSFKQFGGKPIECMVPTDFPESWEQYTEQYCWAQNTYYLSMDKKAVPFNRKLLKEEMKVSYYQWVPFFLLIQAVCFLIPSLLWRMLHGQSGLRINKLVQMCVQADNMKQDQREHTLRNLTMYLQNALKFYRRVQKENIVVHQIVRPLNLPYMPCYVTVIYLSMKFIYAANAILQWFWLNSFLQADKYSFYGLGALQDLLNGSSWQDTGLFPRVTLCDFQARMMGSNNPNYTIQCVLLINLFTEKIFAFLFFWYLILIILCVCSLLYWMLTMIPPWPSRWFVTRHMELSELPFDSKQSQRDVERFVSHYLQFDGVFVLRMIMMHTGVIFGTEIVMNLWKSFYGYETEYHRSHSGHQSQESAAGNYSNASSLERAKRVFLNVLRRRFGKGANAEEQGSLAHPVNDFPDGSDQPYSKTGNKNFPSQNSAATPDTCRKSNL